jgi:hypothetical protein
MPSKDEDSEMQMTQVVNTREMSQEDIATNRVDDSAIAVTKGLKE